MSIFEREQRVKLSAAGLATLRTNRKVKHPFDEATRGTMQGYGRDSQGGYVRVRRDGFATTELFAPEFWEAV